MDRGTIRDLSRKNLGETTAAFWSDTELNGYINIAGHDIAEKVKCIRTNGYLTVIAETPEYTISTSFPGLLSVLEVYYKQDGQTWQKLDETNRTELDWSHQGWLSAESGTPTKYYEDIEEDVIRFYTSPNAINAGTDYARVFYTIDYTDVTSDTTTPAGIPLELQLAMADFVGAYGYQQRGWGDKANDSWQKYYSRLKDYVIERRREKEDKELVSKNYRRA